MSLLECEGREADRPLLSHSRGADTLINNAVLPFLYTALLVSSLFGWLNITFFIFVKHMNDNCMLR